MHLRLLSSALGDPIFLFSNIRPPGTPVALTYLRRRVLIALHFIKGFLRRVGDIFWRIVATTKGQGSLSYYSMLVWTSILTKILGPCL